MSTTTTDARWQAIGHADRAAAKIPTADEHTLRSILAELETSGDTPVYDGMCPPEVIERVRNALKKETRRGN